MRNKLLIISVVAVLGITGCSKEEETAAISPDVEQAQSSVAQTAAAPTAAPASEPTAVVAPAPATNAMPMAVAPTSTNAQAMPATSQSGQANAQSQEPVNTMTPRPLDMPNSSVASGTNVGQDQAQQNLTPNVIAATPASAPALATDQQAASNPVELVDTTKIQEPVTVTGTSPMLEVKAGPEVKQVVTSVTTTVDKTPEAVTKKAEEVVVVGQPKK